jgi:hypothetical protein
VRIIDDSDERAGIDRESRARRDAAVVKRGASALRIDGVA